MRHICDILILKNNTITIIRDETTIPAVGNISEEAVNHHQVLINQIKYMYDRKMEDQVEQNQIGAYELPKQMDTRYFS